MEISEKESVNQDSFPAIISDKKNSCEDIFMKSGESSLVEMKVKDDRKFLISLKLRNKELTIDGKEKKQLIKGLKELMKGTNKNGKKNKWISSSLSARHNLYNSQATIQ